MGRTLKHIRELALSGVAVLASSLGCAATTTARDQLPPLKTVERVEIDRYLGTWYEIANFPQRFQRGCSGTTATYALRSDGQLDVINHCRKGAGESKAVGRARVVDPTTNAKLKVSFFRPFWGDYWIIALDTDYQYAVVGHPSRDYLWILCRTPTMNDTTYRDVLEQLAKMRYDTSRLVRTDQSAPLAPQTFTLAGERR